MAANLVCRVSGHVSDDPIIKVISAFRTVTFILLYNITIYSHTFPRISIVVSFEKIL